MSEAGSEPTIIPDPYTLLLLNYPDVVTVEQMCEMLGGISTKKTAYKLLKVMSTSLNILNKKSSCSAKKSRSETYYN
ncbi:hypothetical protein [Paenibacillus sp. EZ-K15]|uniref:hypothetical protein n=1 Tax=Paenibacillus sp. EZ-K15 TaxID=2044275 RepID=UPI000BF31F07|nr:hypothetical protein [Paenibacillus sp. EZ-K15]